MRRCWPGGEAWWWWAEKPRRRVWACREDASGARSLAGAVSAPKRGWRGASRTQDGARWRAAGRGGVWVGEEAKRVNGGGWWWWWWSGWQSRSRDAATNASAFDLARLGSRRACDWVQAGARGRVLLWWELLLRASSVPCANSTGCSRPRCCRCDAAVQGRRRRGSVRVALRGGHVGSRGRDDGPGPSLTPSAVVLSMSQMLRHWQRCPRPLLVPPPHGAVGAAFAD